MDVDLGAWFSIYGVALWHDYEEDVEGYAEDYMFYYGQTTSLMAQLRPFSGHTSTYPRQNVSANIMSNDGAQLCDFCLEKMVFGHDCSVCVGCGGCVAQAS